MVLLDDRGGKQVILCLDGWIKSKAKLNPKLKPSRSFYEALGPALHRPNVFRSSSKHQDMTAEGNPSAELVHSIASLHEAFAL